ncbi:hypothetical protein BZG01_17745 [Labilibaculum manganireducens]|uniref:DUF4133 domain-containing protein n=1 Tax=Labilibaculum manganireducens TaxID=1940525 RepID=A0A2N3HVU3_9BACT|nr:hypothetical protein BZG01_17745 [Labilibaculum manganireducens]
MESYHIQKTDTSLYVKGFSGNLVYLALYSIIGTFILFVLLYILAGVFTALVVCTPCFFTLLYRLSRIQKKYGHNGWSKKRHAGKLPQFITVKTRICQS